MPVITMMPGVMNSRQDPDAVLNPGTCTTDLNSCPKSSSQMTGWIKVAAANAGWRHKVRSERTVR